jgi:hypothetical protein
VAAVLDLTVRRVARIERRGLRTLRRLSRTTGCASSLSGASIGSGTGESSATGTPRPDLASFSATAALGGAIAVLGERGPAETGDAAIGGDPSSSSSGTGAGAVLGTSAEHTLPKAVAPIAESGSGLSRLVMLLALAIAAAAGVVALRRELR